MLTIISKAKYRKAISRLNYPSVVKDNHKCTVLKSLYNLGVLERRDLKKQGLRSLQFPPIEHGTNDRYMLLMASWSKYYKIMNECPSWLTWLYLAINIPFPFIDAGPIRKIGLAPVVTASFLSVELAWQGKRLHEDLKWRAGSCWFI